MMCLVSNGMDPKYRAEVFMFQFKTQLQGSSLRTFTDD